MKNIIMGYFMVLCDFFLLWAGGEKSEEKVRVMAEQRETSMKNKIGGNNQRSWSCVNKAGQHAWEPMLVGVIVGVPENLGSDGVCVLTSELQAWSAVKEEQDWTTCTMCMWALVALSVSAVEVCALSVTVGMASSYCPLCTVVCASGIHTQPDWTCTWEISNCGTRMQMDYDGFQFRCGT